MNYYEFHMGDWLKKCNHLSMIEDGAYRRLLDWYYTHERPLPAEMREIYRAARANSKDEREAVETVLHEFFEFAEDGWHNVKADKLVAAYVKTASITLDTKLNAAVRQARQRARRSAMFSALRALGEVPEYDTTNRELARLCRQLGANIKWGADGFPLVQIDGKVTAEVTRDVAVNTTMDQSPIPSNVTFAVAQSRKPLDPVRVGAAVRAIRKTGFVSVNGGDPNFQNLIRDGYTDEELRIVAAEALGKGKGWAWFLATVKGRREDAARWAGKPAEPPKTYRQRANEAKLREWVPELFPGKPEA